MSSRPNPVLTAATDQTYESLNATAMRAFNERVLPEGLRLDRTVADPARHFGFTVGERWVSTFGSFARRMVVPGGADVPASAITIVTVAPSFHRQGLLTAMMGHELERCVERGEPLATLWASEAGIYGRFGFGPAVLGSRLSGRNADLRFLPGLDSSGWVDEVDKDAFVAAARPVYDRDRLTRPGSLDRDARWWDFALFDAEPHRDGATEYRYLLHYTDDGAEGSADTSAVDGFALYRFKDNWTDTGPAGEVRIRQLWAGTRGAHAGLWRYLLELDLARTFRYHDAPVDEALRHIVRDARAVNTGIGDNIYVRVVDVAAALAARRYRTELDVVIGVDDPQLPANTGRYHLRGGPHGAVAERTDRPADVELGVLELGTVYLGGVELADLHRAGRVRELSPGAVSAASIAFGWSPAPWCSDHF